jgi:exodeoxyribonuclease-3
MVSLLSWNVNGIRSCLNKGFLDWFRAYSPDLLGIQEIKATPEQLPAEVVEPEGYGTVWNPAERAGYSGTALFFRKETLPEPSSVETVLGSPRFDVPNEGRVIVARFDRAEIPFTLYNIYYPNGQKDDDRLDYKMKFYDVFLEHAQKLAQKGDAASRNQIIMGDVNTAHQPIDLKNPKENEKYSGFLPIERAWIDKFIAAGYHDTWREKHPGEVGYSWWTYRMNARARNIGWRIDYVFVSEALLPNVQEAFILPDVPGSDHCPVGIRIG